MRALDSHDFQLTADPELRPAQRQLGQVRAQPSEQVAGRYELLRRICESPCTYEAFDARLKRKVTLTFLADHIDRHLLAGSGGSPGAAVLDHPGLCRILDADGRAATTDAFVVSEHLVSPAFADIVCTLRSDEVLIDAFAMQLADTLWYLHRRGLGHRRLRESNIHVSLESVADTGTDIAVKLGLFGIYAHQPECLGGNYCSAASDDVHRLGVLLTRAFGSRQHGGAAGHRRGADSRGATGMPASSWNVLVASMLSPEPALRPTAGEVATAIRGQARLPLGGQGASRHATRHRGAAWMDHVRPRRRGARLPDRAP